MTRNSSAAKATNPKEMEAQFRAFQADAAAKNLDPETLLATDYLNHFNEIVMLLDMVPDMPELLEEAREWEPKNYVQFVGESAFSHRDTAVAAYAVIPDRYKIPFETTVAQLDGMIALGIRRLGRWVRESNTHMLREDTKRLTMIIQALMDRASAIIHGSDRAMTQSEIDTLMNRGITSVPTSAEEGVGTMDQSAIDDLFD